MTFVIRTGPTHPGAILYLSDKLILSSDKASAKAFSSIASARRALTKFGKNFSRLYDLTAVPQ